MEWRLTGLCLGLWIALAATLSAQRFVDVSEKTGVVLAPNPQMGNGRGPCFGDFDRDGDQDLILPSGPGRLVAFYRNDGKGTFSDQSAESGLGTCGVARACIPGDIDNDGDLDVYLCQSFAPNRLYLNNGFGVFTDIAVTAGVAWNTNSYTASFGDFDNDGFIDLYVGASAIPRGGIVPNRLYRNNRDRTFTDVTASARVGNSGLTLCSFFHDYDEDLWPDIFVANDRGYDVRKSPNTTYRNNRNGKFSNVGAQIKTNFAIAGMGADFTDVFNDGGLDLIVTNTSEGNLLHLWDPITRTYEEQAHRYGVAGNVEAYGVGFLDFDNDGWQDLYVLNSYLPAFLFRNQGAEAPFVEIASTLGADIKGPKSSLAFVDFDNDGRMEFFVPRDFEPSIFLRNTCVAGNWIKVRTEGTVSNRDGLGARIALTIGGVTQRQFIRSGTGYLGGSDLRAHFGCGGARVVDRIDIRWPSGQEQSFFNVPVNQEIYAMEPRLLLHAPAVPGTSTALSIMAPSDAGRPYHMALGISVEPGLPVGDGRLIPLNPDWLFAYTFYPNTLLPQGTGILSSSGAASSSFPIPALASGLGLTIYASAVTGHRNDPFGIKSILGPLSIVIP